MGSAKKKAIRSVLNRMKVGSWYESQNHVRCLFGEFRKGILRKDGTLAIIHELKDCARRRHYDDELDFSSMTLSYVGQGRGPKQQHNPGNKALKLAAASKGHVHVFLDCGDVFSPKKLLYAGKWKVVKCRRARFGGVSWPRYLFTLKPSQSEISHALSRMFVLIQDHEFETALTTFAKARAALYKRFPGVLRTRDSIAGEVGEYFAIAKYNLSIPTVHGPRRRLIRLRASHRSADAVELGSGKLYAIKTVTTSDPKRLNKKTSNIWGKTLGDDGAGLQKHIHGFLVAILDNDSLNPHEIWKVSTSRAISSKLFTRDKHQGSIKLSVDSRLKKVATLIYSR
jgi:hypothetical protein